MEVNCGMWRVWTWVKHLRLVPFFTVASAAAEAATKNQSTLPTSAGPKNKRFWMLFSTRCYTKAKLSNDVHRRVVIKQNWRLFFCREKIAKNIRTQNLGKCRNFKYRIFIRKRSELKRGVIGGHFDPSGLNRLCNYLLINGPIITYRNTRPFEIILQISWDSSEGWKS